MEENTNITNGRMEEEEKILYKDLSYRLIECAFEVHNVLGPGFSERIYEEAYILELRDKGISYERQNLIEVIYKGVKIGEYRVDLVVEGKVILELKAVSELTDVFEAQLLSYLKAVGLHLGLLINFGGKRVMHKRVIN